MPTEAEYEETIAKLRKENASWRTKLRQEEGIFEGYTPQEKEFLASQLRAAAESGDTKAAGQVFLELGQQMTGQEAEATAKDEGNEEEVAGELTLEAMKRILDERDAAKASKAAEERAKAEAQAVYDEIVEATGFEFGSPEFELALTMGRMDAARGNDVDFSAYKDRVKLGLGQEVTPTVEEGEGAADTEAKPGFPSVGGAAGSGRPTEEAVDWIKEGREAGMTPLQAARQMALAKVRGNNS